MLQFATKVTRGFADVVFTLSGPIGRLTDSVLKPLGSVFDTLVSTISPAVRMIGRLVDFVSALIRPVTTVGAALVKVAGLFVELGTAAGESTMGPVISGLTAVASVIGRAADAFAKFVDGAIKKVRDFLGMPKPINNASVGAAVRNVSMGSVESYQNKAITTAFSLGANPQQDIATTTSEILRVLQDIYKAIPKLPSLPEMPTAKQAAEEVAAATPGGQDILDASRRLSDRVNENWKSVKDWIVSPWAALG